jgi:hypothetical protein
MIVRDDTVEQTQKYEAFDAFHASAPALMSDLMRMFLRERDLNARTKIRARVVALLDFFGVDTVHPPIPALNQDDASRRPAGDVGDYVRAGAVQPMPPVLPAVEAEGGVQLVPGA